MSGKKLIELVDISMILDPNCIATTVKVKGEMHLVCARPSMIIGGMVCCHCQKTPHLYEQMYTQRNCSHSLCFLFNHKHYFIAMCKECRNQRDPGLRYICGKGSDCIIGRTVDDNDFDGLDQTREATIQKINNAKQVAVLCTKPNCNTSILADSVIVLQQSIF